MHLSTADVSIRQHTSASATSAPQYRAQAAVRDLPSVLQEGMYIYIYIPQYRAQAAVRDLPAVGHVEVDEFATVLCDGLVART